VAIASILAGILAGYELRNAMEVEFDLTAEDFIAFNLYHQERLPWGRRHPQWPWWVILGVFGVVLGFTTVVAGTDNERGLLATVGVLGGTAVWAGYSLFMWRERIANQVRRELRRSESGLQEGWFRLKIKPEGITVTDEDGRTTLRWQRVERIAVTDDYAFFYVGEKTASILPRRAFATAEEFKNFVETARQYRKADRKGEAAPPPDQQGRPAEPDTRITTEPPGSPGTTPPPP
jgi:hypothetical protein